MKTLAYIRWADPPLWKATFANFLPLWLFAFAIMPLTILRELAGAAFVLAIAAGIVLLAIRWFTPELILYSLFPIIPVFLFDEMSYRYETPFILLCTLLLTIGIVGNQLSLHKNSVGLGWLILLVVFIGTWVLASHANQNYWQMVSDLGYGCAPDRQGCVSLTGNETPWWILFFRL